MKTTAWLLPISTALSTAVLASSFGLIKGHWNAALAISILGLLWLVAQRGRRGWVASAMLILFVGAAGFGLWLGLGAGRMVLSVVAALSAWDLDHFARRIRETEIEDAAALERIHLRRLLIVDGLGLLLGGAALTVRIELDFGVALLLGLLAVLGLSRTIWLWARETDDESS